MIKLHTMYYVNNMPQHKHEYILILSKLCITFSWFYMIGYIYIYIYIFIYL